MGNSESAACDGQTMGGVKMGLTDRVNTAIERIKLAEQMRERLFDEPFYLAYSGGKDSDCVRILFDLAGVKYDLWHNHTTVDAPETVRYVRSIPNINISYPKMSMWQLIVKKGMPPTRLMRYCCTELKETGGEGRFVVTGVRWAESTRRKQIHDNLEILPKGYKNTVILNADNAENRRQFEHCALKGKRVFNPIVDWEDADVWEFLKYYGCDSNPLYQCGFKRVGCVGCPLARRKIQLAEFERYPKYYDAYLRTFGKMLEERIAKGKYATTWKTGQDVMDWWLNAQK
jgi:phosphoadenosine phosphosulfate reductase